MYHIVYILFICFMVLAWANSPGISRLWLSDSPRCNGAPLPYEKRVATSAIYCWVVSIIETCVFIIGKCFGTKPPPLTSNYNHMIVPRTFTDNYGRDGVFGGRGIAPHLSSRTPITSPNLFTFEPQSAEAYYDFSCSRYNILIFSILLSLVLATIFYDFISTIVFFFVTLPLLSFLIFLRKNTNRRELFEGYLCNSDEVALIFFLFLSATPGVYGIFYLLPFLAFLWCYISYCKIRIHRMISLAQREFPLLAAQAAAETIVAPWHNFWRVAEEHIVVLARRDMDSRTRIIIKILTCVHTFVNATSWDGYINAFSHIILHFNLDKVLSPSYLAGLFLNWVLPNRFRNQSIDSSDFDFRKYSPRLFIEMKESEFFMFSRKMISYLIVTVCSRKKLTEIQHKTVTRIFEMDKDLDFASSSDPSRILEDVSVLWDRAVGMAEKIARGESMSLFHCKTTHSHFSTLYANIAEQHESEPEIACKDPKFMSMLDEACDLAKHLMITLNPRHSRRVNLAAEQHKLLTIRSYHMAKLNSEMMRPMPYAIVIHGKAGVGKSMLIKVIHRLFCRVTQSPDAIYYRTNSKYWDNFDNGKTTIVFDDVGCVKPDKEDEEISGEIIRVINTVGFVTPQAAIEDKGRFSVQAKLVLLTTNLDNNHLDGHFKHRYATISAVARRFPIRIQVELKETHRKIEGTLDNDLLTEDDEAWDFLVQSVRTSPDNPEPIYVTELFTGDLDVLMNFLTPLFLQHVEADRTVNSAEELYNARVDRFTGHTSPCVEESIFKEQSDLDCEPFQRSVQDEESFPYGPSDSPRAIFARACREIRILGESKRIKDDSVLSPSFVRRFAKAQKSRIVKEVKPVKHELLRHVNYADFRSHPYNQFRWTSKSALERVLNSFLPPEEEEALYAYRRKVLFNGAMFTGVVLAIATFLWNRDNRDREGQEPKIHARKLPKPNLTRTTALPRVREYHPQGLIQSTEDIEVENVDPGTEMHRPSVPESENTWKNSDSFPLEPLDVTIPQKSTTMPNLIKLVKKHIFVAKLSLYGKRSRNVIVFGVKGSLYVTNAHGLKDWDGHVSISKEPGIGPLPNSSMHLVTESNIHIDEAQDLAWLNLTFYPPVSDVTKYFPRAPPECPVSGYLVVKDFQARSEAFAIQAIALGRGIFSGGYQRNAILYHGLETKKGMCGCPVLAQYPQGVCIVGIHGGYSSESRKCSALPLYSSMVHSFSETIPCFGPQAEICMTEEEKKSFGPLHYKSTVRFIKEGSLCVYGSRRLVRSVKTRVQHTILYDEVREIFSDTFMAPHMKNFYPPMHIGSYQPFYKALNASMKCSHFPSDLIEQASRMYLSEVLSRITETTPGVSDVCILNEFEAINGVPGVRFIDSINKKTSAGFGRPGTKMKYMEYCDADLVADKNQHLPDGLQYGLNDCIEFSDETRESYLWCRRRILNGTRCSPIFEAHPKDEPVKEDPENPGFPRDKVRIFSGCPLPFSIIVRQYFLPLTRLIQLNPKIFECCAGTNCMSPTWEEMHSHLTAFGSDFIIAGDYKEYDKRMEALSLVWAFWVLIELYHALVPDISHRKSMWAIACDIVFAFTLFRGDLIMFFGNNPSGNPLTVIINSLINSQYMRIAFLKLRPQTCSLSFKENIHLYTYGDDNVMGVSPNVAPWFNHVEIAKCFDDYGITYTSDDKTSEIVPFKKISEVSFLKRKWVKHDSHVWMSCPLDLSSVYKSLTIGIPSKVISPEVQFVETLKGAMREFFQHGKETYNEGRKCVTKLMSSKRLTGLEYQPPRFSVMREDVFRQD